MTNKAYKTTKTNRDYGSLCDWYNHENLVNVEAANVTRPIGKRPAPAAWFVEEHEWHYDEMRDCEAYYETRKPVAGPFVTEDEANEWIATNS